MLDKKSITTLLVVIILFALIPLIIFYFLNVFEIVLVSDVSYYGHNVEIIRKGFFDIFYYDVIVRIDGKDICSFVMDVGKNADDIEISDDEKTYSIDTHNRTKIVFTPQFTEIIGGGGRGFELIADIPISNFGREGIFH